DIPVALDELVVKLMSKAPADRPWDAAAAALALTELRDKANKGAKVAMVWPSAADPAANPGRAGLETAVKSTRARVKTKAAPLGPRGSLNRGLLETAGLGLILLVLAAGIAYVVIPPGQDYLFKQAEVLMKSPHRHDWITARNSFLDPLDRRFPDNPYQS